MDNKKNKNKIDEIDFTPSASSTECTGAAPIGQDMTIEEYQNINDVVGFAPQSVNHIKDKPLPEINLNDKDE